MAKPWEKHQKPKSAPWDKYQADDKPKESADDMAMDAADTLRSVGKTGMEAIGTASNKLDQYAPWGAPLNAAIDGQNYLEAYGKDPSELPSNKDIAAKAGFSEEDFDTPVISNPFTNEHFKASPAGIAGGVFGAVKDPLTYAGGLESMALKGGGKALDYTAEGLSDTAKLRAAKAATGHNISATKKLAKVGKGMAASDAKRAMANLKKSGEMLLEKDPHFKKPAVGWFSNAQSIGERAGERKQFYGEQIGKVGETVDQLAPGAVTRDQLADDMYNFQREIPGVGEGFDVKKRVGTEVDRVRNYRQGMAEDDLGPPAPLSFRDLQELKAQYPYERQSADLLKSSRDASNRMHGIVGDRQTAAVEKAKLAANPDQLKALGEYGPAKERYGLYKNVDDAGAEQGLRTHARRAVSPSSNFLGGQVGGAVANVKDNLTQGGMYGAAAALVHQQLLERGAAFAARSANAVSKKLRRASGLYQKWLPGLQATAKGGNAAFLAAHHQLMNNDPDYRRLMLSQDDEP